MTECANCADRQAIENAFVRYASALDRKQWAELDELFVPNVQTDWLEGKAVQSTRQDMVEYIRFFLEDLPTQHLVSNFQIEVDGNTASARCYVRAYHGGVGKAAHLFQETLGEYQGRLARLDDGWKFTFYGETMFAMGGTWSVFGDKSSELPI